MENKINRKFMKRKLEVSITNDIPGDETISGFSEDQDKATSSGICFDAIKTEYQHTVDRMVKLDNKVYILTTICALMFTKLLDYIERIKLLKPASTEWVSQNLFLQIHYPIFVYITTFCFTVAVILLILLMKNIKLERFECASILKNNLVSYGPDFTTKFIGYRYNQATQINNKRLEGRYRQFNICVVAILISLLLLLCLAFMCNYIVFI